MYAKLSIIEQPTVGRGQGGVPVSFPPKPPLEQEVGAGHILKLSSHGRLYPITVTKITPDFVAFHSDEAVVCQGKTIGGAQGPNLPHEVNVRMGETVVFGTPSYDAGMTWSITVLAIEDQPLSHGREGGTGKAAEPSPAPSVKIRYPPVDWERTQELIQRIEGKIGFKLLLYFTYPGVSIAAAHADLFLDHLRQMGDQDELGLCIVSDGGQITAALRIASIVREYCRRLTVFVPARCASTGTLLALAADRIIMSPSGYLTAIDSSLVHPLNPKGPDNRPTAVSVDQVKRILHFLEQEGPREGPAGEGAYRTLFHYLHPIALGEIDRSSSASQMIAERMMKLHPESFDSQDKIAAIAKHLVSDYPAHGFPILFGEAKEMGLPVEKSDKELSGYLWDMVKLYTSIATPAVTHLSPVFYHREGFPVMIESTDKRTSYRVSFNKRFNQLTRTWQTENDRSNWVTILPSPDTAQPYIVVSLDVPTDTGPVPVIKEEPEASKDKALKTTEES